MNILNKIAFVIICLSKAATSSAQLSPSMHWSFDVDTTKVRHYTDRSRTRTSLNQDAAVGNGFLNLKELDQAFIIRDWQPGSRHALSFWVRFAIDDRPEGTLFSRSHSTKDKDAFFSLALAKDRSLTLFGQSISGAKYNLKSQPASLLAGDWSLVVINVDSLSLELIVNDKMIARTRLSDPMPFGVKIPISIGSRVDSTAIDNAFIGQIDDLRLYDQKLDAEDIKALHAQSNLAKREQIIDVHPKLAYYTLYLNQADKVKHFQIENRDGELNTAIARVKDGKIDISSLTPGSYKIWLVNQEGEVLERHFVKL